MENKMMLLKLIDEYRESIINNPDYILSMSVLNKIDSFCVKNESGEEELDFNTIGSMTDEELAELLYGIGEFWDDGEGKKFINGVTLHDGKDDILQWLQSEAE